jgi:hypothetical protein
LSPITAVEPSKLYLRGNASHRRHRQHQDHPTVHSKGCKRSSGGKRRHSAKRQKRRRASSREPWYSGPDSSGPAYVRAKLPAPQPWHSVVPPWEDPPFDESERFYYRTSEQDAPADVRGFRATREGSPSGGRRR